MEVDHCGSWVKKRNLNLENFLRKIGKDSGFPRYYETCALELKGVLTLRHVIVTETSLFFTENVPKGVLLSIPFSDIRSIEVVADRKALLKSGKMQQCICQHVQVQCASNSNAHQTRSQPKSRDGRKMKSSDGTASGRSSATPTLSPPPDSDSSFTDFSRQSSRLDGSFLPPGLLQAYESPVVPILPPLLAGRGRKTAGSTSSSSLSVHLGLDVGVKHRAFSRRIDRLIWSETGSASDLHCRPSQRRGKKTNKLSISSRPPLTSNSWAGNVQDKEISEEWDEEGDKRRRPRSLDMSQLSRLGQKMLGLVFRSDSIVAKGPPTLNVNSLDEQQGSSSVDFYLYHPNSVMLNELFLFWNRHRLKTLLKEDTDGECGSHSGYRVAEKVVPRLSQLFSNHNQREKLTKFHELLPKLGTLHRALTKYEHLPRILWKEWEIVLRLLHLLESCLTPKEEVREEDDEFFFDRLSSVAVLMDIFRLLLAATGPSWFVGKATNNNNKTLQNSSHISTEMWMFFPPGSSITNIHELTSTLTRMVFSSPLSTLPPMTSGRRETINEVICSPRKFAEGRWLCSTDTKTIQAVSLVHNSSVALLHEILSLVHFSSKDKERVKFISLLQTCPMEPYLLLSMTQVLNLLWDNGVQLGASQTVMLFRYVSTAKTLMTYVPSTLQLCRRSFCEEFRYFVHEESSNKKIPDRYILKPTLLNMCEQLRQEITDK